MKTIRTKTKLREYYQGSDNGKRRVAKKVPRGYYITSRLDYPVRISYGDNTIMIPPRCRRGLVKIKSIKKLGPMPKNVFAVGE